MIGARAPVRAWVALLAVAVCATALTASQATAAVYWARGTIAAADLDGGNPSFAYLEPFRFGSAAPGPACGVAVTPDYLYWAGSLGGGRVNLDGPATPQRVLAGSRSSAVCAIAVDSSHLYWVNSSFGEVWRSNLDGSGAVAIVTGISSPCGIAIGGDHVYWIGPSAIGRAGLDGSQPELSFLPSTSLLPRPHSSCGIASDALHLYWASQRGEIGRVRLDGSESEPDFVGGLGLVGAIAVDGAYLYWTDGEGGGAIGRAGLSGQAVDRAWIAAGVASGRGLAVDSRPTPTPLPLPSFPIHIGVVRHHARLGQIVLDVWVPNRGELTLTGPRLGWKVLTDHAPPYKSGSFRWRLKVWPGNRGRAAARVRRQLHESGRAEVVLRLSFTEAGQLPVTATKAVALLKRPLPRHR